ncbi:cardiac phospholamban isoform X1 [Phycodurus eques]|uniref:cardiac phospholamban isoform X1 n=1 Tax=Phycodurus eques TaxID=693459 RepID=UPI002ACE977D|nr:cardiac phospholamban isoform X1 [Phycodurus eques]
MCLQPRIADISSSLPRQSDVLSSEKKDKRGCRPDPSGPEPPAGRPAVRSRPNSLPQSAKMERVQHITKSAIRRASQIEVTPQAKRNLQELFVNFTLILICLLLIYIIVLLSS